MVQCRNLHRCIEWI